jgi:hypothetical protein
MFKVGDKVRSIKTREEDEVESVPGMSEYDRMNYSSANRGFVLIHNSWEYQKDWELVTPAKGKRGRPRTKPKPVKFLLKYDLDEDPIEEFSTMDEVKERIDYLVKNERSLKRDSMVVYEIKKRWTASVSTKIKLSK